ncbi:MAG TPA: ATP-binding protein [Candidatus Hydrogenedentes bacterium]|nr:ATP-binding protein [Candidatus Hydrogenedentota bacterium]HOS03258.1 ATP-binding protein [Candidatus Hydrogenedentota bacterium]
MHELSLHILDLVENSIRAGASIICVTVFEEPDADFLEICIEDNGPGVDVAPEQAMDPFYTTKAGKRTGLGLSMFRAAAEQAGGRLELSRSEWGGAAVRVTMQLGHIDRAPLGDLAGTLSMLVCANPGIDFWCRVFSQGADQCIRSGVLEQEISRNGGDEFAVAKRYGEAVRIATASLNA